MKRTFWSLIWLLASVLVLALLWRKLRIVVLVPMTWWQLALLVLGLVLVAFIALRVMLGGGRRR
jgi:hypothetical protein